MASFKGLAWNCAGLRSSTASCNKVLYFEKDHKNDFDVAFFLETHHRTEDEIPSELKRYQLTHHIIHSPATENEKYSGIIGVIKRDYDILDSKELIQGRVLNVKIQHRAYNTKYNISALYLETNNHITKAKMENVVAKLKHENEDHQNNIIIGDLNFIDHEKDKVNGLNSTDKAACKIWTLFLMKRTWSTLLGSKIRIEKFGPLLERGRRAIVE